MPTNRIRSTPITQLETRISRVQQGEQTRRQIVDAAAKDFADRGYLGVNLGDVVAKLDLSKGALYHFFPTKDALALEIVNLYMASLRELNEATVAAYDNRLDALVEMSYAAARLSRSNPVIRAGTRLLAERSLIGTDLPLPFAGWVARVTQILEQGQVRGEIKPDVDAPITAATIVAFFHGAQTVSHELDESRHFVRRLELFWCIFIPALRPENPSTGDHVD
jgi:AcrR family transcriptional regulator